MILRHTFAACATAVALLATTGCAVIRDQSTVNEYVEDSAITGSIKTQFAENRAVGATSISVETLKGTVLLSGFAKNSTEKATAETIARNTKGVKSVRNEIAVRP